MNLLCLVTLVSALSDQAQEHLKAVIPERVGEMECHVGTPCSGAKDHICLATPLNSSTRCASVAEVYTHYVSQKQGANKCACENYNCAGTPFCSHGLLLETKRAEKQRTFNNLLQMRQQVAVDPEFTKERMQRASVTHQTEKIMALHENGIEAMHIAHDRDPRVYTDGSFARTVELLSKVKSSFVGCLQNTAKTKPTSYMNLDCVGHADGSCMDGLPFFRQMGLKSAAKCMQFCVSKGLDVSGYSAPECRCGLSNHEVGLLSKANANHQRIAPLKQAKSTHKMLTANGADGCGENMEIHQYNGKYVGGAIPYAYYDINIDEVTYIDAVLTGKWHMEDDRPDDSGEKSQFLEQTLQGKQPWKRKCYPKQCAAGKPWPKSSTSSGRFYDRAVVKYCYKSGTDDTRKAVFSAAMQHWYNRACIRFSHQSCGSGVVTVGLHSSSSCYSTLGKVSNPKINLGWCNSMSNFGSVVHEIGHTLGFNHVQKRKDAGSTVEGKGPYLTIYWDKIPSNWKSQYQPSDKTYMGSNNQGSGDPFSGRANYNFGSIMHYGNTLSGVKVIDTIPVGQTIGQRNGLNTGDISQVWDMYQCKQRAGWTPYPTQYDPQETRMHTPVVVEPADIDPSVLPEVVKCVKTCCKTQIDSC